MYAASYDGGLAETVVGAPTGSIMFDFRATADGNLVEIDGGVRGRLSARIKGGYLVYEAAVDGNWGLIEAEDTRGVADGYWHSAVITVTARGTRLYVDGYQAFCATTTAFLGDLGADASVRVGDLGTPEIADFTVSRSVPSAREVITRARVAQPAVEFAANRLDELDVARFAQTRRGAVDLSFRVRGRMQEGTLFAAGAAGDERLSLRVTPTGIVYRAVAGVGRVREAVAQGRWGDGQWHRVAVVCGHGAVDIYVDGYREAHVPGEFFLGDINGLDEIVIGQDCHGVRLSGEVQSAAIFEQVLGDEQIKRLHGVEPIQTDALFDRGFHDSASYRIPSLLTLTSGTILAGADQRVFNANDAPNDINFVVRRSLDGGETWGPLQTVIDCPGTGEDAACVIDSCMVQDPATGRIHVFVDHFPGGIGQPNCWASTGFDSKGRRLVRDLDMGRYYVDADGAVYTAAGDPTDFQVDAALNITRSGRPAGNLDLAPGTDPEQSLFAIPTSYLQHVYSDDDGLTWSEPEDLNHALKEPWMRFLGTCPGNGIVLRHGANSGRILIPVYFNNDHNWLAMCATVIYSDDHGETWTLASSPNDGRPTPAGPLVPAEFTDEQYSLHEATIVERADGSVLMLMRNQDPRGRVATAESPDGGVTWGEITFDESLPEIWCQPNAVALTSPAGEDRVVFANASLMLPYRGCGVLRLSLDGGQSWERSRTFNPAHYVYQCMCELPDGRIGLLWENECQGLYFSRLPLSFFGIPLAPAEVNEEAQTAD
ncbi:exo-alpha-sialidase [Actinomyces sp. Z3]|uniref:exo-alpha-sialidase n=3 Tax=Actinomyces TaxID=1654 RepID=A0A1M4S070_9ACTO|nr:exo-alpha-sialidase [Actinomyces sp. Z3]RAX23831.1 sialidase [Actinomyces sp. Z3]SHE25602.1 sialidases [Actinomyces glycerinitolerans]